jgi:hypothetical protein
VCTANVRERVPLDIVRILSRVTASLRRHKVTENLSTELRERNRLSLHLAIHTDRNVTQGLQQLQRQKATQ